MKARHLGECRPCNDATTERFLSRHPGEAADVTLTRREDVFYIALFLSLVFVIFWDWLHSSHLLYIFYAFYISVILFRLLTACPALFGRPEILVSRDEISAIRKEDWPVYTVLVPLYREPEVAAKIVHHIDRMDYPREKLEVLLLLEQDDNLTRQALANEQLPGYMRVIDIPDTLPRTKPKACNWGLRAAKGEYVVIYDAEDRPDRDQLKKSVLAFQKVPKRVICLQAKLSYYNPDQNLLTRWFTMEYAAWFDLYLPGLYRLNLPIPLGGTSNHFRRKVLDEIRGWDPFNVAEDCDLGIRLHRMGYRTAMLDTTTWEEANSRLRNWVRQRSRWVKGYLQTHLVHTRKPRRILAELGPVGSLSFLMSVGGHSLLLLVNPLFWVFALVALGLAGGEILAGSDFWEVISRPLHVGVPGLASAGLGTGPGQFVSGVFKSVTTLLFLANFLFIVINLLGCLKRRLGGWYPILALASPIYWILISAAAWKGFTQLLTRPHYWEKTDHGLFREPESPSEADKELLVETENNQGP